MNNKYIIISRKIILIITDIEKQKPRSPNNHFRTDGHDQRSLHHKNNDSRSLNIFVIII